MVYEDCKIYGPYVRKDDRMHICVKFPNKNRTTVSYPKYLMEVHLNRYLLPNETVDHIDRDFTNNDITNLQILDRNEHARLDAKRLKGQQFNCPECNSTIVLDDKKLSSVLKNNRRKNRKITGPFCNKSCAGLYGAKVQNNVIEKLQQIKSSENIFFMIK